MSSPSSEQHMDSFPVVPEMSILDLECMSEEEFWECAHQRAHAIPELPSHAEYLECTLDRGTCLIALRDLAEVLPPPHRLARLPGMPVWMVGIMAWRGETLAVVSLDTSLWSAYPPSLPRVTDAMVLVAHAGNHTLGLLVPALGFTTTIEDEKISAWPASSDQTSGGGTGIVEGMYADVPILNMSALLTSLVQQIGMATAHG
jgi:chemotaxis signal transduction protein